MAAPRWPIVVGIAALGGVLMWFGARRHPAPASAPPPAPVGASGALAPGVGPAAIFAPAGPSLGSGSGSGHPFGGDPAAVPAVAEPVEPVEPLDPGPSPPQLAFSAQTRDPRWAGTTETEIKRRLGRLQGAQLEAAECRQDQCELTIGGSTDGVSSALATLESKRGLLGFARSVLLTAPEERDGKLVIRAYAQFERGDAPAE